MYRGREAREIINTNIIFKLFVTAGAHVAKHGRQEKEENSLYPSSSERDGRIARSEVPEKE